MTSPPRWEVRSLQMAISGGRANPVGFSERPIQAIFAAVDSTEIACSRIAQVDQSLRRELVRHQHVYDADTKRSRDRRGTSWPASGDDRRPPGLSLAQAPRHFHPGKFRRVTNDRIFGPKAGCPRVSVGESIQGERGNPAKDCTARPCSRNGKPCPTQSHDQFSSNLCCRATLA